MLRETQSTPSSSSVLLIFRRLIVLRPWMQFSSRSEIWVVLVIEEDSMSGMDASRKMVASSSPILSSWSKSFSSSERDLGRIGFSTWTGSGISSSWSTKSSMLLHQVVAGVSGSSGLARCWHLLASPPGNSDDARRRQLGCQVFHEPRINPQAHGIPL